MKPKHPGGRPQLLAKRATRIKLLLSLTDGNSRVKAARSVGVHYQTLLNTCRRDPDFAAQVEHAEQRGKSQLSASVVEAAKTDWRAAAFQLCRKWPAEWGPSPTEHLPAILRGLVDAVLPELPAEHHAAVRARAEQFITAMRKGAPAQ